MTTIATTRLHITPLKPELLPTVLGPRLTAIAENISYHTISTFPENDYGFLELPQQDAKKLTSKLNGAILKGRKMKVEEARSKKRSRTAEEQDKPTQPEEPRKKSKKSKSEEGVVQGHELSEDRKVKRGWTETKAEKSTKNKLEKKSKKKKDSKYQAPSKYTEKEELLFRTIVPANKEDLVTDKKKNKKKHGKDAVVHEFEKTAKQPSFLRDTTSASNTVAEFVEQLGWVNDQGEAVEPVPTSAKKRATKAEGLRIMTPASIAAKGSEAQGASAALASSSAKAVLSPPVSISALSVNKKNPSAEDPAEDTSSSGSSSLDEEAAEGADFESGSDAASASDISEEIGAEEQAIADGAETQTDLLPQTPPKVHPLEALFKKPKLPDSQGELAKPSLEVETTFSFFGQGATEDQDEEEIPPMPATPFTSHDLYSRGVRSAAPTPDTAHPGRFTSFADAMGISAEVHSDNEDVPDDVDIPKALSTADQPQESTQSDFEKRFWAERSQNNRAWKEQRRTAMKEQRQKENRLRRPRNR